MKTGICRPSVRRPTSFSISFPYEASRTIGTKFHIEAPDSGEKKVYTNSSSLLAKMAKMPMYGKNAIKFFYPEQRNWDLTTMNKALRTRGLQNLFN